jgi:hypothetical protein
MAQYIKTNTTWATTEIDLNFLYDINIARFQEILIKRRSKNPNYPAAQMNELNRLTSFKKLTSFCRET